MKNNFYKQTIEESPTGYALNESEEVFRIIFENASTGICITAPDGQLLIVNPKFCEIFGYTKEELKKNKFSDITHPDDINISKEGSIKLLDGSINNFSIEKRYIKKEGSIIWVNMTAMLMKDSKGKPKYFITTIYDITSRKQAEDALKESEKLLIAAQHIAHVGNWRLKLDSKMFWASKEAFAIYGIEQDSQYMSATDARKYVYPEYHELLDGKLVGLITKEEKYDVEFKLKNGKTGEECFVQSKAVLVFDEKGKATELVGTIQDITERKKKEEEITYLSYHDQLTGLYNRSFFEKELERLDNGKNLPISIVMGDVNGLKLINDSFGHGVGDSLLKKVAEVIKNGFRADDIIARFGGDEFSIILPKTSAFETEIIIKNIKNLASKEKVGSLNISISFGTETKDNELENIHETIKNTEDHMYRHKLYESSSMRCKTIDLIMNTLYEKNNREMQHSKRVSEICKKIACKMNFDKDYINQIRIAGLMHDIGKIGIDEKILNNTQKLDADEWKEIKKHSEIGFRILSSVNEFSEIAKYILEHHEYWNGEGYPRGLKGEEISVQARIIAVADSFDAMTSDRPYGKKFSEEEAIYEIRRCSDTQFDPEIASLFIEKVLGDS